jgi:NAD(P)-dependent dehydrogenase (short-subunit alcohol dehydrogenase family)
VAVVTGANSGIGYETALQLATHGARVILAARNKDKIDDAVKRLKAQRPTSAVEGYVVDLSRFRRARAPELRAKRGRATRRSRSTRELRHTHACMHACSLTRAPPCARSSMDAFAKELKDKAKLKALHILVANAGVFMPTHEKTAEGFEPQMGINHVGTVYLTQLLLPLLKAGKPSRCARARAWLACRLHTLMRAPRSCADGVRVCVRCLVRAAWLWCHPRWPPTCRRCRGRTWGAKS